MSQKSFVLAWLEAYNKELGISGVANRLDISNSTASAKANYMRRKGINLPAMKRQKKSVDVVESLNSLIAARI